MAVQDVAPSLAYLSGTSGGLCETLELDEAEQADAEPNEHDDADIS